MNDKKMTFTDRCRIWIKGIVDPIASFLLKIGLTANAVTVIGCVGQLIPCWFIFQGKFLCAGILLAVFAVSDVIDGTMAKMSNGGTGTKFGAVLDSITDRYAEFIVFGGILLYYTANGMLLWTAVCVAAIMGAFLVPYTRAKGELFGLDMRMGIMTRVERYLTVVISLLIGFPNIGMTIIAVLGNITAIQRILHMRKNLK